MPPQFQALQPAVADKLQGLARNGLPDVLADNIGERDRLFREEVTGSVCPDVCSTSSHARRRESCHNWHMCCTKMAHR